VNFLQQELEKDTVQTTRLLMLKQQMGEQHQVQQLQRQLKNNYEIIRNTKTNSHFTT
jgi:hypothetical protein